MHPCACIKHTGGHRWRGGCAAIQARASSLLHVAIEEKMHLQTGSWKKWSGQIGSKTYHPKVYGVKAATVHVDKFGALIYLVQKALCILPRKG